MVLKMRDLEGALAWHRLLIVSLSISSPFATKLISCLANDYFVYPSLYLGMTMWLISFYWYVRGNVMWDFYKVTFAYMLFVFLSSFLNHELTFWMGGVHWDGRVGTRSLGLCKFYCLPTRCSFTWEKLILLFFPRHY